MMITRAGPRARLWGVHSHHGAWQTGVDVCASPQVAALAGRADAMEHEARRAVCQLVEQLVTTGAPAPDVELLRQLKAHCKRSAALVDTAFEQLFIHLRKDHSQVRLSVLQVSNSRAGHRATAGRFAVMRCATLAVPPLPTPPTPPLGALARGA